ncbi:MAG: hypothetical protein IPI35_18535 [Deltaproteobacteria bacterium]|nr:hypothetical protein [Deltaproteobacteria bacterium]
MRLAALVALTLGLFAAPVYAQRRPLRREDDLAFLKEGEEAAAKKAAEAGKSSDFSLYSAEDEDDLADFKVAPPPKPKAEPKPEPKPEMVAVTPPAAAKPPGRPLPRPRQLSPGAASWLSCPCSSPTARRTSPASIGSWLRSGPAA